MFSKLGLNIVRSSKLVSPSRLPLHLASLSSSLRQPSAAHAFPLANSSLDRFQQQLRSFSTNKNADDEEIITDTGSDGKQLSSSSKHPGGGGGGAVSTYVGQKYEYAKEKTQIGWGIMVVFAFLGVVVYVVSKFIDYRLYLKAKKELNFKELERILGHIEHTALNHERMGMPDAKREVKDGVKMVSIIFYVKGEQSELMVLANFEDTIYNPPLKSMTGFLTREGRIVATLPLYPAKK
eukprot:TRINITY_DN4081_c0_g1_i1.p1 TRINITY_DN4081_c0_g1~~TRINITY_DN4081_c0_g1_i1.p1  ORF type:complete len:237 (-),score=111.96 TRINITY_DN4081_c0_g1_i1:79-789(-)